jgi:hypothetical protein
MRSCRIAPRIADKRGPPLACAHNGPPSDATPQRCSSQWDNQRHDQQVNGNCNLNSSPLDQFEIGLALRLIVVPSRKGIAQGLLRFIVVACSRKVVGNEMLGRSWPSSSHAPAHDRCWQILLRENREMLVK